MKTTTIIIILEVEGVSLENVPLSLVFPQQLQHQEAVRIVEDHLFHQQYHLQVVVQQIIQQQ